MDIDSLIKEQKKTQEAIRLLRESRTYEELLKEIPKRELDWKEICNEPDPWDYEESSRYYDMLAATFVEKAVESFGKAKLCLGKVREQYEGDIKEWEEYREYCKTLPKRQRGYWKTKYTNPVCLKFFEDYEKANGIEDSIYKEAIRGGKQ